VVNFIFYATIIVCKAAFSVSSSFEY